MLRVHPPVGLPSKPARLACAAGAASVTTLMTASQPGLFHHPSPRHWLQPTPDLLARAEPCRRLPGRAERLHCVQAVVAAYQVQPAQGLRLAEARPQPGAATAR